MRINFLVSDFPTGFKKTFVLELTKYIPDVNRFVFVASDFDNNALTDIYMKFILSMFEENGIYFDESYVVDNRLSSEKAKETISNATIVWLAGGPTLQQIKSIKSLDLIPVLQQRQGITIGMSAGAINMAKKVVLAKDLNDNVLQTSIYDGIGLVEINIEPHINLATSIHLEDVRKASEIMPIIGLPDDSFIVDVNGKQIFFGPYFIFENGKAKS